MKKRLLGGLLLGCVAILVTGCYQTVEGQMRAGVPLARDYVESRYERPVDQLHKAAVRVLKFNGTLTRDDRVGNTLAAKVNTRTVHVKLTEEEPNLTHVKVQARTKAGGPDVALASEIDKQIALQLPR